MTKIKHLVLTGALAIALLLSGSTGATAAVKCDFTRDLDLGVEGEDVRCLQQYLNSQGFVIATSGVGSTGSETTQFKDLTKKAVMTWQTAQGVTPATGYFGAKSRAKYMELVNGTATPTTPAPTTPTTPAPSSDSEIALLKQLVASLTSRVNTLENRLDDVAEDNDDDEDEDEDEDDEESEAEDLIEEAEDLIDEVQEAIDEAEDDGEITDDAEDLLEEAEDALEDAQEAFDDEDWDDAIDFADEAIELAEDAEDEL